MFLPNLDGDTVDAPGRRKDGCGGSGRGRRTAAGLLTLGGWCSGGTAFRRGHFLRKREAVSKICQKWPQKVTGCPEMTFCKEMEEKTTLTFDEWTLDFKVNLHCTTQTRRSTMPKATGHALITFCNSFCHFFRYFTIV